MLALQGTSEGMNGRAYNEMTSMRFWGADCSDDGARAISILLKNPPLDGKQAIGFVELLDCNIGPRGMQYLGEAIGRSGNTTLVGLQLNHNKGIEVNVVTSSSPFPFPSLSLSICVCVVALLSYFSVQSLNLLYS